MWLRDGLKDRGGVEKASLHVSATGTRAVLQRHEQSGEVSNRSAVVSVSLGR